MNLYGWDASPTVFCTDTLQTSTHTHTQETKRTSVDMSRVKSDALPHSLMPKMVTCGTAMEPRGGAGEESSRRGLDVPDFLSECNSLAVEIGSSMDAESISEKLSFSGSVNSFGNEVDGSSGEPRQTQTVGTDEMFSIMDSVMAVARRHSETLVGKEGDATKTPPAQQPPKGGRPLSAPSKARSKSAGTAGLSRGSHTLPPNLSGAEIRKMVAQRKESLEEERQRRRVTIEEGAMAASNVSWG